MLQNSGGSVGRSVIFTLAAQVDPNAKAVFAKFASDMVKTQADILQKSEQLAAVSKDRKAKKEKAEADKSARDMFKMDKIIADNYLKTHLKAIDDKTKREKQAAEDVAKWHARIRQNSIQLEYRDNLKAIADKKKQEAEFASWRERVRNNSARMAEQIERRDALANQRHGRKMEHAREAVIGGVGNIARGVAYSGLIGQENTQAILGTVAGVEGVSSLYRGAASTAKGASTLTGMSIGAGGAGAAGVAAIGAIIAWLPALASAVRGATVIIKGSATTGRGDISGGLGEGVAGTYSDALGYVPKGLRKGASAQFAIAQSGLGILPHLMGGAGLDPYLNLAASKEKITSQQQAAIEEQKQLAGRTLLIQTQGQNQARGGQDTGSARSQLVKNADLLSRFGSGGEETSDVQALRQNTIASMERFKQLSLDAARAQVEGSRDQLTNLRQSHSEMKAMADEALKAYQGDIAKAGSLDTEGMSKLREIARKKSAGEKLGSEEIGFASQFNEFRDYVNSEQERRASEFGLSDLFGGGKRKAEELRRSEVAGAEEITKTELEVTQKHEFIIKIEKGEYSDPAINAIREQLKAFESQVDSKVETALVAYANRRRIP